MALACLPLASCLEDPAPLESGDEVTDPGLIGLWESDINGDPMIVTIRRDGDGHLVAEVQAYWQPGPKAATEHYEIVLARFDTNRYVSFRDTNISPNYKVARYEFVNHDRFCVFGIFSDALAADLDRKVLPGAIQKSDIFLPTAALSASSAELRDYFRERGESAFRRENDAALVFRRTSSSVLPPPKWPPKHDQDEAKPTPCRP